MISSGTRVTPSKKMIDLKQIADDVENNWFIKSLTHIGSLTECIHLEVCEWSDEANNCRRYASKWKCTSIYRTTTMIQGRSDVLINDYVN